MDYAGVNYLFVLLNHRPDSADGFSMKVIIQDLRTKAYFSADGRWVTDKSDATDFLTLLRAYHFARINTSGRFEVLLYCPEDDYSAGIITGIGISDSNTPMESEPFEIPVQYARARITSPACRRKFLTTFDEGRNHLN
jgi:hypothetical protein